MKKRNKILIVDDAEINRSLLSDMLSDDYDIIEAANGVEAIAEINRSHSELSLILLDIVMPEMDGFDVLASMNKSGLIDSIPVIIISAETSSAYIDHSYDLGAVEYISRPFDEKPVRRRVNNTIMLYSKQKLLENMVTEQMLEKEKTNLIMVEILSHIVEFRNGESGLHVLHIRLMTETLLKRLVRLTDQYELSSADISLIANASAMHDIGKIVIPEHILNKPGKLTPEEYEIMKSHSAAGADMLAGISYYKTEELVRVAHDICRWHHERYDGRGYPDGLKGEEIPISAQVVALADVYDALTNERIYKPAFSHEDAIKMILNGECGVFNPLLLKCLLDAAPSLEKELHVRSAGGISRTEVQSAARNLMQSGSVSNRTLALLEQERTKHQFFASMSKEIQFEYDRHSALLTLSEWGAAQLGLNPIIANPKDSPELAEVFSPVDYADLRARLLGSTPEDPTVVHAYCLTVNGARHWYKAIARPLWLGDELSELTGIIGKFTDIHEERLELDHLKSIARHDSLTGLLNRDYSRQAIERILSDARGTERKFAMLLFDLDNFKAANDTMGHIFGDRVLQHVSQRLRNGIRDDDIAARIGGDEFLVFMEYREASLPLVKRIFESVHDDFQGFEIKASMGVALAEAGDCDYEAIFHRADQALYAAKQRGRNRYFYYDDSMSGLFSVLSHVDRSGEERTEIKDD